MCRGRGGNSRSAACTKETGAEQTGPPLRLREGAIAAAFWDEEEEEEEEEGGAICMQRRFPRLMAW